MPPLHSGDSGEAHGEDGDEEQIEFRPPLPPDDRIWRHPSEVAATAAPAAARVRHAPPPRLLGVAALSALIGATLSLGVAAAVGGFDRGTTVVERNVAVRPVTSRSSADDTVAAIAARTAPAIAAVRVGRDAAPTDGTEAATTGDPAQASGSGLVLRSDGYLLTNAHLVTGARTIEVRLHGGRSAEATLIGTDPTTDVAVIRVDVGDLEPAAMGSVDDVRVGDDAIAIGVTAGGAWSPEVTTGVISGLGRRLGLGDGRVLHDMILLDVPFTPEAAGGPLLDGRGGVVGITNRITATTSDLAPLGVATPIDVALRVADQLIEHGRARHVWLGIEGSDLESGAASDLAIAGGALVTRVLPASPAAAGGVEVDDVVVAVAGTPIASMSELIGALRAHEPDDEVTLRIRRGDRTVEVVVTLVEREP